MHDTTRSLNDHCSYRPVLVLFLFESYDAIIMTYCGNFACSVFSSLGRFRTAVCSMQQSLLEVSRRRASGWVPGAENLEWLWIVFSPS